MTSWRGPLGPRQEASEGQSCDGCGPAARLGGAGQGAVRVGNTSRAARPCGADGLPPTSQALSSVVESFV